MIKTSHSKASGGKPDHTHGKVRKAAQSVNNGLQLNKAPQLSRENLLAVFENISEAVIVLHENGSILELNSSALSLFATGRDEALNANFCSDFCLPRNPLEKFSELWARLKDGEFFCFEVKGKRCAESKVFPAEIVLKKITWDGQEAAMATVRDITRYKEDKKALRIRRQQLSAILDGTPVATFVIDNEHRVISWNKACEMLTGVSRKKVLGRRVDSGIFYPGPKRPVLADVVLDMDELKMVELYREKNLARHLLIPEAFEASDRVVLQGVPKDIYFLAARYRNISGQVIGVIETISDITERTRVENALRASEKRLKEVTADIPGVVYQYHVEEGGPGRFTFISEGIRKMFGLDPGKVMQDQGLFFSSMEHEVQQKFKKAFRLCTELQCECMEEFEFILEKGSDDKRWIKNRALSRVKKTGETLWKGVMTDITREKRTEKLRVDVERIVRHDMKSPLMGIGGLSRLLLKEDLSPKQRQFAAAINQSALKLMRMINHSMSLLKMEEGKYQLNPETFNIIDVFYTLDDEFKASLESSSVNMEYFLDGSPLSQGNVCMVSGEKILLESLFANLVQNALDASPQGGTITVNICRAEDRVEVDIHNMQAIPESVRDNFFHRYVTFGKKFGTGIGTYSAMLIARTHGGDIRFRTSEEKGTNLIVTLPGPSKESQ